jgi:hypothetical protein
MLLTHWLAILRNGIEREARHAHEAARRSGRAIGQRLLARWRGGAMQPAYARRANHALTRWSRRQRLG